ncbi:hypothetical protein BU25DRAFT_413567 [Macroventuria anomochaeta]|uniref:Uncharacterized protein n=1 Tax=Macroventuria anomochaeta TaxID=301207 RepID=A0ACB6RQT1_9PLEO|nr:uncharacterized protein BU25DRAFT_413567 [Macroventuria anomochaeta]KAF2624315.1 hypothetical protein BU25DRAFT_413567 [Macroventuria anomochaeta]
MEANRLFMLVIFAIVGVTKVMHANDAFLFGLGANGGCVVFWEGGDERVDSGPASVRTC